MAGIRKASRRIKNTYKSRAPTADCATWIAPHLPRTGSREQRQSKSHDRMCHVAALSLRGERRSPRLGVSVVRVNFAMTSQCTSPRFNRNALRTRFFMPCLFHGTYCCPHENAFRSPSHDRCPTARGECGLSSDDNLESTFTQSARRQDQSQKSGPTQTRGSAAAGCARIRNCSVRVSAAVFDFGQRVPGACFVQPALTKRLV